MKSVIIVLALIALAVIAASYIVRTADVTGIGTTKTEGSRHLFDSPSTIVY